MRRREPLIRTARQPYVPARALVRSLPPGVAPLEVRGYGWLVVAQPHQEAERRQERGALPRRVLTLREVIGKGVAVVSFGPPGDEPDGADEQPPERFIAWNGDRTEATLGLTTYYNGTNATGYDIRVKKLRGHWVVVEMTMTWIS